MDYSEVCKLPCNNNPLLVANRARTARHRNFQNLEWKDLIKFNIDDYIDKQRKIGMDIDIKDVEPINSLWNRLTPTQQEAFITLAKEASVINKNVARANEDSTNRMNLNTTHQKIDDPFGASLFGGTRNFHEKTDFEALVLTSGSSFF